MADEPDNIVDLTRARYNQIDAKLERILAAQETTNQRLSSLEVHTSMRSNTCWRLSRLNRSWLGRGSSCKN